MKTNLKMKLLVLLVCLVNSQSIKVHINQTVPHEVNTELPSHLGNYPRKWVTDNPQVFGFPFKKLNYGIIECWVTTCCVPLGFGMLPIHYWIDSNYIMLNVLWYGPEWTLGFGCIDP